MIYAVPKDFRESESLARMHAARLARFARSKGYKLDYDDAYSEVCLIWVQCVKNYNPAHEVVFRTYWQQAINHSFTKIINKIVDPTLAFASREIHERDSNQKGGIFDVPDGNEGVEEVVVRRIDMAKAAKKTALINRLMKIAGEQHPELEQEIKAARAQRSYAKQLGVTIPESYTSLTPDAMMWVFRMNWRARRLVRREIKELAKHVR